MAETPPLNDEQALSAAEQVVHHYRGVKYLEDLIRHVRDARKDLPVLQETLTALRAEQAAALEATAAVKAQLERERTVYDQWAAETAESRKALTTDVADERARLTAGLAQLRGESTTLATQRDALAQQVAGLKNDAGLWTDRLAGLQSDVKAMGQELSDLKGALAALKKKHGLSA